MKNNYWMKLWFDVLRDPKMGMLPDRLWRRVIELFLIAGQEGEDGLLPDVPQIAWQLNKPVSAIVTDLQKIADTGIVVEFEPGKWMVSNFKKRNEPVDQVKRIKDFRMRERYENSNENVTQVKRERNAPLQVRYQEEQKNRRTDTEGRDKEIVDSSSSSFEDVYRSLTGIEPKKTEEEKALIQRFTKLGVLPTEYQKAIQEMQEKGYKIASMLSAETWTMNNRNGKKARKPASGSYEAWKIKLNQHSQLEA